MNILEKKANINFLYKFIKLIRFKEEPIQLLGSAGLASQKYYSDFDFFSPISGKYSINNIKNTIINIITKADKDNDVYFIELKVEYKDGSKDKYFTIEEVHNMKLRNNIDFIKVDYIINIDNIFYELSIIYKFVIDFDNNKLIESTTDDMNQLLEEGNYYKALKRLFNIIKLSSEDEYIPELVPLSKFFNSDIGALYKLNSNLKTIKLLLENYNDDMTMKRININIKDIYKQMPKKLRSLKNIDEIIKYNDKIINDKAKVIFNSYLLEN